MAAVRITGTGKALPGDPVSNKDILGFVKIKDLDEEWIQKKIRISTRYVSRDLSKGIYSSSPRPGMCNSDLAAKAGSLALERAGLDHNDVDLLIVSTCTPDYPVPSTAVFVQEKMGILKCNAMDIRSACCGFTQGMIAAHQFLKTGFYRNAVVIGSDVGTVFGNLDTAQEGSTRSDQVNAVMFGDAAAAIVLEAFSEEEVSQGAVHGLEVTFMTQNSVGAGQKPGMYLPGGGSLHPISQSVVSGGLGWFKQDFRTILEHGPELYYHGMQDAFKSLGISVSDVDLFVPHQANGRVPELAPKLGIPSERVFMNFDKYGNTANASLPLCLDDLVQEDELEEGDNLLFLAAESTKWLYGSWMIRWSSMKKGSASRPPRRKKSKQTLLQAAWASIVWGLLTLVITLKAMVRQQSRAVSACERAQPLLNSTQVTENAQTESKQSSEGSTFRHRSNKQRKQ